jgi:hypothetical protein
VAVALRAGLDRRAMGLTGDRLRSGLVWGGAAFGLVLAVVVSILVLTVIPEELTFRGVLLCAGSEAWGPRKGALVSSAVFGLWHIAPTLNTAGGNAQLSGAGSTPGGTAAVVVAAVVVTFVAGMVFSWLRLRSGASGRRCSPTWAPTGSRSWSPGSPSADPNGDTVRPRHVAPERPEDETMRAIR